MNKLLKRNTVNHLFTTKRSPLTLALSVVLSLPYQHAGATIYEQTTVDGDFTELHNGDYLVDKNGTSDVSQGNLTVTQTGRVLAGNGENIKLSGGYSSSGSVTNSTLTFSGKISSSTGNLQ
ncbi:MAG: hypothetical protein J6M93_05500 [Succinivibrio sp.]|nr:hypothetical protein [Succinivibrio sp.]